MQNDSSNEEPERISFPLLAKDIYADFGYKNYSSFKGLIARCQKRCEDWKMDPKVHFEPVGKDYKLNRFACFLLSEIISNQSKVSAPILAAVRPEDSYRLGWYLEPLKLEMYLMFP